MEKNPAYTLQLSQKFDFQPSTTKPDKKNNPTIQSGQIWPLGGFKGGFYFMKINNIQI